MIQGNNGGNYVKRNLETGKYVISPSICFGYGSR